MVIKSSMFISATNLRQLIRPLLPTIMNRIVKAVLQTTKRDHSFGSNCDKPRVAFLSNSLSHCADKSGSILEVK